MKLIQDTGIIGRGVQLFSNLFSSGEQALQEQKIGRGTELLLGAAVNVYRFHSNPSNSSKF